MKFTRILSAVVLAAALAVTVRAVTNLDIPLWGAVSKTLTGKGQFRCE